jgi:beta-barrel assembly-enhancing protease
MNSKIREFDELLKEWNSTSLGRKQFLASIPLLLAACNSGTSDRNREGDNSGQKVYLSPEDEAKLTEQVLPEMRKDYPKIENPELQTYISNLGQKIVRANNLEANPYKYNFTVVGVNYVNAFALPAGTVFVTAPLIAMAETEAELAGVVGHEIGHIQARHTAERMAQAKDSESKSWVYGGVGGVLGAGAGLLLGSKLCPPKDNACIAKYSVAGAAAGAVGGLLIVKYQFMANSREDEMEADRIGFKTALNAGFSKAHIGKFYEKLLMMEKESKKDSNPVISSISDAMSTHPPSEERVKQMNQLVTEASNKQAPITSSTEFEKVQKISKTWIDSQRKG